MAISTTVVDKNLLLLVIIVIVSDFTSAQALLTQFSALETLITVAKVY